jgi:hypothetical protein
MSIEDPIEAGQRDLMRCADRCHRDLALVVGNDGVLVDGDKTSPSH